MTKVNHDANSMSIEKRAAFSPFQALAKSMETIETVQHHLIALSESDDSNEMTLLKIGTVFQIFLIDNLASGKKVKEMTEEDWKSIAGKVSQYAIMEDGSKYSEFVFTLYADYIDVSANALSKFATQESLDRIKALSETIRQNTDGLRNGQISESEYVEKCLWLSLEAMIKLIACSLTPLIGPDFANMTEAASQLAFEYGRAVLYSKEQAILQEYIENQHILDERLKKEYEEYQAELQENANRFQNLLEKAFSSDIHESLVQSAELARETGVSKEKLMTTVEEIDAFFLD